ncbi:MAG: hypothetical protein QNJ69_06445 [Gammaproteobacteria bacterium]|nr:hypothetical protein [Gammaproteobacteria bacterium]
MSFAFTRNLLTTTAIAFALLGCGGNGSSDNDDNAGGPSRSFYMGFTPFPYDADPATLLTVVDDVYAKLNNDADMVLHHLEEGIPWNAALADDLLTPASVSFPYSNHIEIDWETRKAKTPASHKKYIAITPINLGRNSLAPWRDTANEQDLQAPFAGHAASGDFNAPDVKNAYLNYCLRVIEFFEPDYLAIGIEVNLLRRNTNAATWANYLELNQHVYSNLKAQHPDLPIFVSVSPVEMLSGYVDPPAKFAGDPAGYRSTQLTALNDLLMHSDYYAISLYPFLTAYFASDFPAEMFADMFALSSKPTVIAETGMLAENMTAFAIPFESSIGKQDDYIASMLAAANDNNLLFVNWFVLQDYDRLCDYFGGCSDEDGLWRDTGVYDGDGNSRPSYTTWKSFLDRPRE